MWQNCQTSLLVGGRCLPRPDWDEDVAPVVGGGRPWRWTHQAAHFHHGGRPTRPPRTNKAPPSGSIREPSRLVRSPPPLTSVRKLHRRAVWSGPAKLWAGVRTNVLIRWGRKLQGLFFCRENVEKLTGTSAPKGLRRRRTLAALAETLHFHWHELQEELLLQWIMHSFQSKGHFNELYWM